VIEIRGGIEGTRISGLSSAVDGAGNGAMSIAANVSCVWPARAMLGESPCWDPRSGCVFWVDIKGARLHAFDTANGARRTWTPQHRIFSLDTPPASWRSPSGGLGAWFVGCSEIGFAWINIDGEAVMLHPIANPEPGRRENRFNDGKMGPDGRYWAGTMHDLEAEPSGSLYAFSASGETSVIDIGYIVSNGPAFSPDGRTLYHTDSARRTIFRFDLSTEGRASNRSVLMQFDEDEGYPDGMTTDHDGNLWVAMWDGARLQKLSPTGEQLGHLPMPAARPTSCTFADDVLFATSAALGASTSDALAGGLFRIRLG
jgi:xylono-1,5-lactonase